MSSQTLSDFPAKPLSFSSVLLFWWGNVWEKGSQPFVFMCVHCCPVSGSLDSEDSSTDVCWKPCSTSLPTRSIILCEKYEGWVMRYLNLEEVRILKITSHATCFWCCLKDLHTTATLKHAPSRLFKALIFLSKTPCLCGFWMPDVLPHFLIPFCSFVFCIFPLMVWVWSSQLGPNSFLFLGFHRLIPCRGLCILKSPSTAF